MVAIRLTPAEATVLREALRQYVSDLRMEIADTEAMGLREELKREEALLKRVIDELAAGGSPA